MNADSGSQNHSAPEGATTAGALLRAAREKQGLHIAALAAAIKVSPRKLEALESNRLEELPDATFARALAQTVCRTLKIDPRPVLERLPAAGPQPLVPPDTGLNEPYRESAARAARGRDDSPLARLAMRPMIWGAALLLLAALALYFVPLDRWRDAVMLPAPVAAPASSALLPSPAPPAEAASVAVAAADAASALPAAAVSAASAAAATAATSPASAPAVETVFAAPPPGADAASPVVAGALRLQVREPSWIEVRDGRGNALLSRTVQPGEQLGLDGATPLQLVVGNVAATELVFRGKPVDLAARSRDNVARFQLP